MTRMGRGIKRLLQRFRRSQRGNVAMMAGIALPVLLMISAGAIDLHHMAKVRSELQDALDAATLAAARSNSTKDADIQAIGMASLRANMPRYFGDGSLDEANFEIGEKHQIKSSAKVQVKTIVANIFLPPYGQLFDDYMPMSASSEVMRASRNVEVVMALDITKSMQGAMTELINASSALVDIIVQDGSGHFKTRVAVVPYGAAVNMGGFADKMRGPLQGKRDITSIKWSKDSSDIISSSSSVANSRLTITTTQNVYNSLNVGDWVMYTSKTSSGASAVVRKSTIRTKDANNKFTLNSTGGTNSVAFRRCLYDQCAVGLVHNNHGLKNGDRVQISDVRNLTGLNATWPSVKVEDENVFSVVLSSASMYNGTGGKFDCFADGCARRYYKVLGQSKNYDLRGDNCVSNRPFVNNEPLDSLPKEGEWVGRAYMTNLSERPASNNNYPKFNEDYACTYPVVMPLSDDRDTLKAYIRGMKAAGSTAGHVGIEMAWYMITPSMNSIFNVSEPAEKFDPTRTVKAAILMTDGEFNTPYCDGVAVRTNPADSWADLVFNQRGNELYIDCPAPAKAKIFEDAVKICEAMKAQGIVVYTIGFDLESSVVRGGIDTAYEAMRACATSPDGHFHPVSGKANLSEAFKQIGRDITRLRIAR